MYEQLVEETPVPGGLGPRLPSGLSAAGKLSKAPRTSASLADQAKPPSVGLLIGALEPIIFPLLQAVPISAHSFKALRLKSLVQLLGRGEAARLPQESVNLEEPGVQPGWVTWARLLHAHILGFASARRCPGVTTPPHVVSGVGHSSVSHHNYYFTGENLPDFWVSI